MITYLFVPRTKEEILKIIDENSKSLDNLPFNKITCKNIKQIAIKNLNPSNDFIILNKISCLKTVIARDHLWCLNKLIDFNGRVYDNEFILMYKK